MLQSHLKHHYLRLVFIASLCLSCLSPAIAQPVRIGHLTDLTGIGAMLGVQSTFGVDLAVEDLRKTGQEVVVYTEDHKMNLSQAASAANYLLTAKEVDFIIADLGGPSLAVVDQVAQARRLFLSLSASEEVVKKGTASFRSSLDYRDGCAKAGSMLKKIPGEVAFLGAFAEFSDLCLAGLREQISNVAVQQFNTGEDIRPMIARYKAHPPAAIVLIGFEQDLVTAVRRAREIGLSTPFVVPSLYLTPLVRKAVGDLLAGSYVFGFSPLDKAFIDKVLARDPKRDLNNVEFAALAYMHTIQIVQAFKKCPERDLECVTHRLEEAETPSLLRFKKWQNHKALFEISMYRWTGKESELIQ